MEGSEAKATEAGSDAAEEAEAGSEAGSEVMAMAAAGSAGVLEAGSVGETAVTAQVEGARAEAEQHTLEGGTHTTRYTRLCSQRLTMCHLPTPRKTSPGSCSSRRSG